MVTNTRPSGKKWSKFTKQTTVSGTASINMEDGGKNVTIAVDDFASQYQLAELLVEGSGTPVLQIAGSQNKIRSIESGGGISVAVSPSNGIELSVDLANGVSGGAESFVDVTASPIVARTFQAGSGINVGQAGDVIQISTSATPAPSNTIIINKEADFPTQDATTITLDAETQFIIGASFTTAKRFIVGDKSLITGNNILSPVLTYSGTGTMFTSVDASLTIRDLQVDHPLSQGYDFTDTVGGQIRFLSDKVRDLSGTKYGTFNNLQTVLIEGASSLDIDDGITNLGANGIIFSISKLFMQSTSPTFTFLDMSNSTPSTIEIDDGVAVGVAGSVGITGLASSGNVTPGAIATVQGCNFSGLDIPLDTITVDDVRWFFSGNSGIQDTRKDALMSFSGNILETTIAAINTPVKVNSVWTCNGDSHFTCDTTGRITYVGENDVRVPIDFSSSFIAASGGDKQITVYIAINGVPVVVTGKGGTVSSSKAASITAIWQHTFTSGDYVELWCENNQDTVNLIASQSVGRAN